MVFSWLATRCSHAISFSTLNDLVAPFPSVAISFVMLSINRTSVIMHVSSKWRRKTLCGFSYILWYELAVLYKELHAKVLVWQSPRIRLFLHERMRTSAAPWGQGCKGRNRWRWGACLPQKMWVKGRTQEDCGCFLQGALSWDPSHLETASLSATTLNCCGSPLYLCES